MIVRLTVAAGAVALGAFGAGAQAPTRVIQGVVRDSISRAFVPGAVVLGFNAVDEAIGRTLTDDRGQFRVVAVPGGTLRVVRIGFEPRDIHISALAFDAPVSIAMFRLPPVLEGVQVAGSRLCPRTDDAGAAFVLWEQARAGLLAAVVAREARPSISRWLLFERAVLPDSGRVAWQQRTWRMGRTTRPFTAAEPAEAFARQGYMRTTSDGRVFNAPDADVLLDETFATTHCFRVARDTVRRADQIGIAFEPAPGRADVVDVRGTLWLDRGTPAVRELDFRYTGLIPEETQEGLGGAITFRTMPNGIPFIEHWVLRIPEFIGQPERRGNGPRMTLLHVKETGGEVVHAAWPDGTSWDTRLGQLTGQVVDAATQAPIPGALLFLESASDTSVTDAQGMFALRHILPGRYTLRVSETRPAPNRRLRRGSVPVHLRRGDSVAVILEM